VKILFTITAYPPSVGGAQIHTHQLARTLSSANDIRVITQWTENRTDWLLGTTLNAPAQIEDYKIDGIEVRPFTLTPREKISLTPYVIGYYGIRGIAIREISNVFTSKIEESAEGFDLIHSIKIGREPLQDASLKIARKLNIPVIFTPLHHPRWKGWRYKEFLKIYRKGDGLIVLTNTEKKFFCRMGILEEKIMVTGVGPILADSFDPQRFRAKYNLGEDPIVLFLGQKFEFKGISGLLSAAKQVWNKLPDVRFVFVGPRTKFSRRLFSRIKDSRITEIDTVSLNEKTDALAACDLLCVPSTQESFGGVYIEAWMMKRPVIGGDLSAIRDVINEGTDGFLVKYDPSQIAERIVRLIQTPSLRSQMGEAGYRKAIKNYTWETIAKKTESFYRKILESTRS